MSFQSLNCFVVAVKTVQQKRELPNDCYLTTVCHQYAGVFLNLLDLLSEAFRSEFHFIVFHVGVRSLGGGDTGGIGGIFLISGSPIILDGCSPSLIFLPGGGIGGGGGASGRSPMYFLLIANSCAYAFDGAQVAQTYNHLTGLPP